MAEAVAVVTPIVDRLVQLLMIKGNLLKGVHREVKSLKDELESILCFLKDAEQRMEKGEIKDGVKTWVKQVREEAYNIEDVIDEYVLYMAQNQHRRQFISLLRRTSHMFQALKPCHDIASEIKKIKASLREIKDRGERYSFNSLAQGSSSSSTNAEDLNIRLGSLFLEDDEFLDIHFTRDELIGRLVEGVSTRMVISLIGTGGIGKTTLAKKVYDTDVVKGNFDCLAWINVSPSYNLENLLRLMAKQLCPALEPSVSKTNIIEELIGHLRDFLQAKRYVIVFDDVWQINFWRFVRNALPNNNKGSRVIVTTRNDMIGASCKDTSFDIVKMLPPLSREMAWELFCKKAFRFELEGHCPQELEHLSLEIVEKCQGLPLVISSVAGLLSTKERSLAEWQKLNDNLHSELETNPHLSNISKILSLSYNNLPYYLKPCFLYFGIFPKDRLITEIRLYRHWIAEGFIKEKRGKTLEQVAEEYLNELIQRNLVQVQGLFCGGSDKLCRVHDLMRDIILSRADELGFCQILDEQKTSYEGKCRRLSIHSSAKSFVAANEVSGVRSIFLFDVEEQLTKFFMINCIQKYKLLKVLDFSDVPLDYLPRELGNLFHLKYLNLRNTKIKMLPKSIGNLQNLQVLDLINTSVQELPMEINRLQNLRHIFGFYHDRTIGYCLSAFQGLKMHEGIGSLKQLQTLMNIEVHGRIDLVKELETLRQLRFLGVSKLTSELGRALCNSVEKMNHLERLTLLSNTENDILDIEALSSPSRSLWRLILMGRIVKLSDWILNLQNLKTLHLSFSRLSNDPLKHLQVLHNLEYLYLHQAYDGDELHFEAGGFQKLKLLELCELNGLKVIIIDKGTSPLLEDLRIGACPQLKKVPSNIQNLGNLKHIEISEMPREFVLGMQPDGHPHCWKVKHVESIRIWYKTQGNLYDVL